MAFHMFPVDVEGERLDDLEEAADDIVFRSESVTWEGAGGSVHGLGDPQEKSAVVGGGA
jgi:hypothetical protein